MMQEHFLEITYTIDYDTYKRYYFYTVGLKRHMIFWLPFLYLSALVMGIFWSSPILVILVCAAAVLFPLIFSIPSIQYKKTKEMFEAKNKMIFYDSHIYVESTSAVANHTGTHSYDLFIKVCETDSAFYLYIKNGQCYPIAKKYLDEQQIPALHNFLVYRFDPQKKFRISKS